MNKSKTCVGKDNFERLNYLYQLSTVMAHTKNTAASGLYSNLLINIAKKSVQRLDPEIKRTICKKCHCVLISGVSLKVRIRKKKIIHTCKLCNTTKIYKTGKNHELWVQSEAAVQSVLQF